MRSPRLVAGSALIVLVYLVLGLTNVFTRAPWCDEAWFGNPAYNLAYKGFMGTTVLDPASSTWKSVKLTGIDRHTYWVMPLSLLVNAAGFRIFGFSIFSMRLLSLFWGLIALCAWGAILWKLTGQPLLDTGQPGTDRGGLPLPDAGVRRPYGCDDGSSRVERRRRLPAAARAQLRLAVAVSQSARGDGLLHASQRRHAGADPGRHHALLRSPSAYTSARWRWRQFRISRSAPVGHCTSRRVRRISWRSFWATPAGRGPTITSPLAALRLEISHRYMDRFGLAAMVFSSPDG